MSKPTQAKVTIDKIYQKPIAGQPVTVPVITKAKTPVVKVRWCNIVKPFEYSGVKPQIPRFSITCLFDPNVPADEEFITKLRLMEHNEGTDTVLKDDIVKNELQEPVKSGLHWLKFQTKEKIIIIDGQTKREIDLTEEIPYGSDVIVTFDVVRYSQRLLNAPPKKGLNFKPKIVTIVKSASPINTFQTNEDYEGAPF